MKVVALKSFFGSGISAKKGKILDVDEKLAKAWLKAGVVVKPKDFTDGEPAEATTSTLTPPAPSDDATGDEDTTGEVVDGDGSESETETETDGETDGEPAEGEPENDNDNMKGNK